MVRTVKVRTCFSDDISEIPRPNFPLVHGKDHVVPNTIYSRGRHMSWCDSGDGIIHSSDVANLLVKIVSPRQSRCDANRDENDTIKGTLL